MTILTPNRLYLDLDMNFLSNPNSEDVTKVVDVNSVKQAIKLLVLTRFGERLFQPDMGSPIYGLLFEPVDPITTQVLQQSIIQVIQNHESRCLLNEVRVVPDEDHNAYNITIYFTVVSIPLPITFSFTLSRLR